MVRLSFKDKQVTGNVGLFFVCYKLSRRGWNVLPTSRNAKGIDILAYGSQGERILTIQAKGFTGIESVGPFKKESEVLADFYIVVSHVYENPLTYILTKDEVKSHLTPPKGDNVYWLNPEDYKLPEFFEKWDKIGFGFSEPSEIDQIARIDKEGVIR